MLLSILGWMAAGFAVGTLIRIVFPDSQSRNMPITIALGIIGGVVGGLIATLVFGPGISPPYDFSAGWLSWVLAVVGAALAVGGYYSASKRKT